MSLGVPFKICSSLSHYQGLCKNLILILHSTHQLIEYFRVQDLQAYSSSLEVIEIKKSHWSKFDFTILLNDPPSEIFKYPGGGGGGFGQGKKVGHQNWLKVLKQHF